MIKLLLLALLAVVPAKASEFNQASSIIINISSGSGGGGGGGGVSCSSCIGIPGTFALWTGTDTLGSYDLWVSTQLIGGELVALIPPLANQTNFSGYVIATDTNIPSTVGAAYLYNPLTGQALITGGGVSGSVAISSRGFINIDSANGLPLNLNPSGNWTVLGGIGSGGLSALFGITASSVSVLGDVGLTGTLRGVDTQMSGDVVASGKVQASLASYFAASLTASSMTATGDAKVGGLLSLGLNIVSATCSGATSCSMLCAGTQNVSGGGCSSVGGAAISASFPSSLNGWFCQAISSDVGSSVTAYGICSGVAP
jgi:hypothetical protein